MYYSKELSPRFKQESFSIEAGWINNSEILHNWSRQQVFLIGFRNGSGMTKYYKGKGLYISFELCLGFWYLSFHLS